MSNRKEISLTIGEINEKLGLMNQLRTQEGRTKLDYAIRRTQDAAISASKAAKKQYDLDLEDLRIKYATVYPEDHPEKEKKGCLVTDERGNFIFTQENTNAFNKELRARNEKFENELITFSPFSAKEEWPECQDIDPLLHNKLVGILFENEINLDEEEEEASVKQESPLKIVSEENHSISEAQEEQVQEQV